MTQPQRKRRQRRERIKVIKKCIQECYSAILHVEWHCSNIVKKFKLFPFGNLDAELLWT